MKKILVTLVSLGTALSLLIGTPALSSRESGLTKALEQLPPEDLQEVLENLGVSTIRAPEPKTGATYDDPSARGDDGELQMGVAWPDPRFTINLTSQGQHDGTVTDNLTGLVWTKKADKFTNWETACADCNKLRDLGGDLKDGSKLGDWRLPNVRELHSLIDYGEFAPALPSGHPFVGVQSAAYWSSTPGPFWEGHGVVWTVKFLNGVVDYSGTMEWAYNGAWCVRDRK